MSFHAAVPHADSRTRAGAAAILAAVRRYRRWWLAAAVLLFIGGCAVSLHRLDYRVSDLRLLPSLALFAGLVPATLLYGAVGLLLLAKGSRVRLSFVTAFRSNCAAQLAELLPVPGGAIVRTGALVSAGLKTGRSAELVILAALLWVFTAGSAAAVALVLILGDGRPAAAALAALAMVAAIVWRLARLTGPKIAAALLGHRILGCLLMAARLTVAFAAIGHAQPVLTAFIFGLATIAGSAAAIAPAGLGLSELFGAALATTVGVDPFAAFLAIAVNRLLGLAATGILFLGMELRAGRSPRHG